MKKVLMINDYTTGGGAEIIFNQTIKLLEQKYSIEVYTGDYNNYNKKNPLSYIYNFFHKTHLSKHLYQFKPEIIHLHNYYHILSPSILVAIKEYKKKHSNVKVIYTAHDFHLCFPNSGYYFFKEKQLVKITQNNKYAIFNKIDHRGWFYSFLKLSQWYLAYKILNLTKTIDIIISPSVFLKNILNLELKQKKEIHLIRNPFEYKACDCIKKNNNNSPLKMVFVGRISFEKGIIEFIQALLSYKEKYVFDIIGTGDPTYISKINKIKNSNQVNLLGYKSREEILDILCNYDALVLPSLWYENFPTVILEASSKKINILTCNYGGMYELGQIVGNSYFFDINDTKSILEAVTTCHSSIYNFSKINNHFFDSISEESYKRQISNLYESKLL